MSCEMQARDVDNISKYQYIDIFINPYSISVLL